MRNTMWRASVVIGVGLLVAVPGRAADPAAIDKAIRNGVNFIRSTGPGGAWGGMAPTALNALALLECEVPEDDPLIVKAAENIRKGSVAATDTYGIALAILFLDRLNDPGDVPIIESLAVRLLEGQDGTGGWSYNCPGNGPDETRRLETVITKRGTELSTRTDTKPGARRTMKDLAPPIQARLERMTVAPTDKKHKADNSNTQFANIALWVAHRHGVPVENAIARLELRYRLGQRADGGWDYYSDPQPPGTPFGDKAKVVGEEGSTATMTCAGLVGLMTVHGLLAERGTSKKAWDVKADPALKTGLICLASAIRKPVTKHTKELPHVGKKSYYFLWALERVCVGLNLSTLGRKDWYSWGAEFIIANQQTDGSWKGEYAGNNADTCFALLFLKRANAVHDLTAGIGNRLGDVAERKLDGGGVGGSALKKPPKEPDVAPIVTTPDTKEVPGVGVKPASDPPPVSSAAAQLADELIKAPAAAQAIALTKLRDGKGVEYTEALTAVIGRLDDRGKERARDALVERLARMKAETLRRYLGDDEPEIRRAAAVACASRELKSHVPDLIGLLRDRSPVVGRGAHAALQALTGQKIPEDASAWEAWWKTQKKD